MVSWEERAERVRSGEPELADVAVDIDVSTYRAMCEAFFRHTADSIVLCHSITGEYYEVSDLFCELTGYSRAELLGQTSVTLRLVDPEGVRMQIELDGVSGRRGLYENHLTRKDGTKRWVEFSHQELGENRTLVIIRDVTDAKAMEESLRLLASTDCLTRVLNRGSFQEQAEVSLALWPGAVLVLVDVDGLKALNDTWGHAVGDEAIIAVAHALVEAAGRDALVGRLGGDEFAALLNGSTEEPMFALRRMKAALANIPLTSIDMSVSASVGVASGRLAYAALEQAADASMYEGKRDRTQVH